MDRCILRVLLDFFSFFNYGAADGVWMCIFKAKFVEVEELV